MVQQVPGHPLHVNNNPVQPGGSDESEPGLNLPGAVTRVVAVLWYLAACLTDSQWVILCRSLMLTLFPTLHITLIALFIIICMDDIRYSSAPPQTLIWKITLLKKMPFPIASLCLNLVNFLICFRAFSLVGSSFV